MDDVDEPASSSSSNHHNHNHNRGDGTADASNAVVNHGTTGSTSTPTVPVSFVTSLPPPPRAAQYLSSTTSSSLDATAKRLYWDRSHYDSPASQLQALKQSTTVYVGNLAFTTRSRQVRAHFGTAVSSSGSGRPGRIRAIHMGLDRLKKTPCGFGFVEFAQRDDALAAVAHVSGTKLDGKVIRVELDAGFQPGRQYGRGVSGGQVRDDKAKQQQQQQNHQRGSFFSSMTTADRKRPRTESTSHHSSNTGGERLPSQADQRGDNGEHQEASSRSYDAGQENAGEREQKGGGGGDNFDEEEDGEPAAKRRRM